MIPSVQTLPTAFCGQGSASTILGTVTDSTGALALDASVTVTNIEANVSQVVHTSVEGTYTVPYLNLGCCRIDGQRRGFAPVTVGNIRLVVDQQARVAAKLKLGVGPITSRRNPRLIRS
jgi:hypothetical protein